MLYVFHGTDIKSSRKKAQVLIESLRQKKPDAAFESVAADNWNSSILESHVGGQGLFSNKYIVFLNRVTENAEAKEKISDYIPVLNESQNIFIMLEGKLTVELKKVLEKHAEKIVVTDQKTVAKGFAKNEFNIFALGDALGSRDSFKAWTLYRKAIENGFEPENIMGTLFWQVKAIISAATARSATEAGLSQFVFNNSKRFATNYSSAELKNLMHSIITIYHDSHRGLVDSEIALEKLVLGIGHK